MPIDQPPAIEITQTKDGVRFDLKGEQPIMISQGNIMFPSHWTAERADKWLAEHPRQQK